MEETRPIWTDGRRENGTWYWGKSERIQWFKWKRGSPAYQDKWSHIRMTSPKNGFLMVDVNPGDTAVPLCESGN